MPTSAGPQYSRARFRRLTFSRTGTRTLDPNRPVRSVRSRAVYRGRSHTASARSGRFGATASVKRIAVGPRALVQSSIPNLAPGARGDSLLQTMIHRRRCASPRGAREGAASKRPNFRVRRVAREFDPTRKWPYTPDTRGPGRPDGVFISRSLYGSSPISGVDRRGPRPPLLTWCYEASRRQEGDRGPEPSYFPAGRLGRLRGQG
jgi:hypothetical protein